MRDVIAEIGTKQGQKPSEAIDRFFNDLKDYDAKVGFEREVRRLETITETTKLGAKKGRQKRKHLSESTMT